MQAHQDQHNNAAQLAAILPAEKTLHVGGDAIVIRQFKTGSLPAVLSAVQPIMYMLNDPQNLDINTLFLLYADECLTLIAVLSGKERAWVNALELDECIQLLAELLEVNLDFFIRKVLPQLTKTVQRLTQSVKQLKTANIPGA